MVRALLTMPILLRACAGEVTPAAESTCQVGLRIHGDALAKAIEKAAACASDADCVVMHESVSCPGTITIDLCDLAVHRLVLDYYDRDAVSQAMCEASANSELGCTISASCKSHAEPVCRSGECVFADELE